MAEKIPETGAVQAVIQASTQSVLAVSVLARSRQILFRSWIRDASRIRGSLNQVAAMLANSINKNDFVVDKSRLLGASSRRLTEKTAKALDKAFVTIDTEIQMSVESAIVRASTNQQKYLRSLGLDPISSSRMQKIRFAVLGELKKEFPRGSGMNYFNRLDAIKQYHKQQIGKVLTRSYEPGQAAPKVTRDLKTGISYTRPGRTPLIGGSASKKAQRLMVAEEARLANMIELKVMKSMGVKLSYWRLSAAHRDYGGGEICEVLSRSVGSDVTPELRSLNITPSSVSTKGLYTLDSYPDYPHPHCICYPEAALLGT